MNFVEQALSSASFDICLYLARYLAVISPTGGPSLTSRMKGCYLEFTRVFIDEFFVSLRTNKALRGEQIPQRKGSLIYKRKF